MAIYQGRIKTEDTWVTALTTELPERTLTAKVLNTFEACRDVEPLEIEKNPWAQLQHTLNEGQKLNNLNYSCK